MGWIRWLLLGSLPVPRPCDSMNVIYYWNDLDCYQWPTHPRWLNSDKWEPIATSLSSVLPYNVHVYESKVYLTFLEEKVSGTTGWFKSLNLESDLDIHASFLLPFSLLGSLGSTRGRTITQKGNGLKKVFHLHTLFPRLNGWQPYVSSIHQYEVRTKILCHW